jgi:hypothetical protein
MSVLSQTLESSSHFNSILGAALSEYKLKTGNDLTNNSLAKELQVCDSAEDVLDIIQRESKAFDKVRDGDKRLMKCIGPSVDVLYTISSALGAGVGIVRTIRDDLGYIVSLSCSCFLLQAQFFPESASSLLFVRPWFYLLDRYNADTSQAAKDVRTSHEVLIDLFERIQFFLKRLGVHTQISPTKDMVEILVKIMAETIFILSIATNEMQQSRASKLFL